MVYNLTVDGTETECKIQDNKLILGGTNGTAVDALDIINVEEDGNSAFKLHIINKSEDPKWRRSVIRGSGGSNKCSKFICEIKDLMKQVSPKPRKFLVMINPVGGKQSGEKSYKDIIAPVFNLAGIATEVIVSEKPKHVIDVMNSYNFNGTDGIVLCGGDGTYHECISTLIQRFQNEAGIDVNDINAPIKPLPFPVAMIPTGTGNLIARTNYCTDDIETAALHIVKGRIKRRCVCGYYQYGRHLTYSGQSFAYGDLADMLYKMNKTRGMKGALRYLILFYYFLFKRRKQFQVEIEYTNEIEDKESQREQCTKENLQLKEHSGVLRGSYFHISTLIDDFTDEGFRYNARLQNTFSTTLSLFKPCGRWDLISHFKGLVQNTHDTFQRDFIQNVKFTRYKFKLLDDGEDHNSDTDGQERILAVDGETVKFSGKEFECRWYKDIIPVYSNY